MLRRLVILLTLLATSPGWASPPKTRPKKQAPSSWDTARTTTKPVAGTPERFTFLVTAKSVTALENHLPHGGDLSASPITFASLITSKPGKSRTIGNVGYILGAKPGNVAGTYRQDTGWYPSKWEMKHLSHADMDSRVRQSYPPQQIGYFLPVPRPASESGDIDSPRRLLDKTDRGHNEVVLIGRSQSGESLRVTGIFLRTKNGKELASDKEVRAFSDAARKWRVPVVRIPTE